MASPGDVGRRQGTVKAKVVLLGEGAVGKTSLVLRYSENKFNDKHVQTLQASFVEKRLNIGGKRIQLAIWDTAGQERYHALGPIYYRDSQGAIIVYDITDEDSFHKARNWIKELRRMLGDKVTLCIVGNKIDLDKKRTVIEKDALDYAASVGAKHYYTSAKQGKGVAELFLDLAKRILESGSSTSLASSDTHQRAPNTSQASRARNNLIISDESEHAASHQGNSGGGGSCC